MLRSGYILAFEIRGLAERWVARGDWARLETMLRDTSVPKTYSEETLRHYRRAWSRPGAITAMMSWYRSMLKRRPGADEAVREVEPPLLLIWGVRDHALGFEMAEPSLEYSRDGRLVVIDEGTHWVVQERVEEVQGLIEEFFETLKAPNDPGEYPSQENTEVEALFTLFAERNDAGPRGR